MTHVAKAHGFLDALHEKHGKWRTVPNPPIQQIPKAGQPEPAAPANPPAQEKPLPPVRDGSFLEEGYQELRTAFGSVPCPVCPSMAAPTFNTWSKWKKHLYQVIVEKQSMN